MQSLLPSSTAVSRAFLLTPRRTILPQLYYVSRRFFIGISSLGSWRSYGLLLHYLRLSAPLLAHSRKMLLKGEVGFLFFIFYLHSPYFSGIEMQQSKEHSAQSLLFSFRSGPVS